jgi:hypothetical protein
MRDQTLWKRLEAYDFGLSNVGGNLFADLVKTTTLTTAQVEAVMTEYRRFLYLAATAGEVVAPSRLIDDVWHRHMQDSRAYLNGLCEGVIGKVIHHMPGRAAPAADPAYQRTLTLYRSEFGKRPNDMIWPTAEQTKSRARSNLQFGCAFISFLVIAFLFWTPALMFIPVGIGYFWCMYYIDSAPLQLRKLTDQNSSGGCGSDCGGGD